MPSLATTLMGFGVGLGVLAEAVGLAGTGSLWASPSWRWFSTWRLVG
jgi:hypothetical protein